MQESLTLRVSSQLAQRVPSMSPSGDSLTRKKVLAYMGDIKGDTSSLLNISLTSGTALSLEAWGYVEIQISLESKSLFTIFTFI